MLIGSRTVDTQSFIKASLLTLWSWHPGLQLWFSITNGAATGEQYATWSTWYTRTSSDGVRRNVSRQCSRFNLTVDRPSNFSGNSCKFSPGFSIISQRGTLACSGKKATRQVSPQSWSDSFLKVSWFTLNEKNVFFQEREKEGENSLPRENQGKEV